MGRDGAAYKSDLGRTSRESSENQNCLNSAIRDHPETAPLIRLRSLSAAVIIAPSVELLSDDQSSRWATPNIPIVSQVEVRAICPLGIGVAVADIAEDDTSDRLR